MPSLIIFYLVGSWLLDPKVTLFLIVILLKDRVGNLGVLSEHELLDKITFALFTLR